MQESTICYRCDAIATTREHVPAKCFFPKEHRLNLITVPSCQLHNNESSKDDEYVRGIIVSSEGNNEAARQHWKGMVRNTFIKRPALLSTTFLQQRGNSFFHDRRRMDSVMVKIAHALHFKEYGIHWLSQPYPYYESMFDDDGKSDVELRLSGFKLELPRDVYSGANPQVFKYYFQEGKINNKKDCILKMVFYGGFSVLVVPLGIDHVGDPLTKGFKLKPR